MFGSEFLECQPSAPQDGRGEAAGQAQTPEPTALTFFTSWPSVTIPKRRKSMPDDPFAHHSSGAGGDAPFARHKAAVAEIRSLLQQIHSLVGGSTLCAVNQY